MAHFDQHCKDCEMILGQRHENVNIWMDELFRYLGPQHRKVRHHKRGVNEAYQKFGPEGAKAAIVHIVRDCGGLPDDEVYEETALGIVLAPEMLIYDGADEKAQDKFRKAVEKVFEEWQQKV